MFAIPGGVQPGGGVVVPDPQPPIGKWRRCGSGGIDHASNGNSLARVTCLCNTAPPRECAPLPGQLFGIHPLDRSAVTALACTEGSRTTWTQRQVATCQKTRLAAKTVSLPAGKDCGGSSERIRDIRIFDPAQRDYGTFLYYQVDHNGNRLPEV